MFLTKLILKNFRGFEQATLELDPRLTVLVGPNGSGKSSLLRAVELVASHLAECRMGRGRGYGLPADAFDVRSGASGAAELTAHWQEPSASLSMKVSLDEAGKVVVAAAPSGAEQPPLSFHLEPSGRSRLRADISPAMGSHGRLSAELAPPYEAWSDENNRGFLPFERFWGWFKELEDAENAERVEKRDLDYNDPKLLFVRQSVERILGAAFSGLRVNRDRPYSVLVKKGDQALSVEQLSDGERSLLILAASISRRLAVLSGVSGNPGEQSATVLIDEVEQHLHGRWQRELLPRLLEAFPSVQFVATTHSPIVLSSIDKAHVRVLRDFQIDSLQDATYGRDANALFEDVFGVSRRPEEMARKLDAIGRQLDSGNIEDAKRELENLASVLGEDDADIVRLRVLSGFLEDHEPQTAAGEDG